MIASEHPIQSSSVLPGGDAAFARFQVSSGLRDGVRIVLRAAGGDVDAVRALERRSEIGLRRALGANRGQIRVQFLTESVALATLGGVAGTALGLLATTAYAAYHHWPAVIPRSATVAGLAGAVLVGIGAGVYPSVRAARLTRTEALATV